MMRGRIRCPIFQQPGRLSPVGLILAAALMSAVLMPMGAAARTVEAELAPVVPLRSFDRSEQTPLPQSTIMGLLQDRRGVLWIATLDGVASFDGKTIVRVPEESGSPHSGVLAGLAPERHGGVLAFGAAGVYIFTPGGGWRFLAAPEAIVTACEDAKGFVWAADTDGHVWRYFTPSPQAHWEPAAIAGVPHFVSQLIAAGNDVIAAGRHRVVRISGGEVRAIGGKAPLPGTITALLESREGTTWIGLIGSGAPLAYAPAGATAWSDVKVPGWDVLRVRALAEDHTGAIWAGGESGGVAAGTPQSGWKILTSVNGLKSSMVDVIAPTDDGSVWFGFNGDGIQQLLSHRWTHRNSVDPRLARFGRARIFGISPRPEGGAFIAAFDQGLWVWDGIHLTIFGPEDGLTQDVRCGFEPAPGILWAGARTGLFESNLNHGGRFHEIFTLPGRMETIGNFVTAISRGPDGAFYLGTSSAGIFRLRAGRWEPAAGWNRVLPDSDITSLFLSREGELWVGTIRGVAIFGREAPRVLTVERTPGLPRSVSAITQLPDGAIVIGGSGGFAVEHGESWSFHSGAEVYSLQAAPDGSLWLGTSEGVVHYLSGGDETVFDSRNGLLDSECNTGGLLRLPNGDLLAGTMASLAQFHPDAAPMPAPNLHCFWIATPPGGRIGPSNRNLHLAWLAPYLRPFPVEYRYSVPRLGSSWSPPSPQNELNLENLAPGHWRIEVEARVTGTRAAHWTAPLLLDVQAAPAYWETWYARGAAAAAAILLIALAVWGRTKQLARRATALDAEVARRTAELSQANERLADAKQALEKLARLDPLTELYNRRAAEERLSAIFAAAHRQPAPVALFLFDLDNFKAINDRGGHAAGDSILTATAAACRNVFRETDLIVRYGGDEFLVVFTGVTDQQALNLARRLEEMIRSLPALELPGGESVRADFSGGISWSPTGVGVTVEELLHQADRALYEAKRRGRSQIVLASAIGRQRFTGTLKIGPE